MLRWHTHAPACGFFLRWMNLPFFGELSALFAKRAVKCFSQAASHANNSMKVCSES
jgi:hypothetical protein